MEALISEIQIYEDRQPNGQWLKSIKFRLPTIEEDINLSLEDDKHVDTNVLISVAGIECTRLKILGKKADKVKIYMQQKILTKCAGKNTIVLQQNTLCL